VNLSLSSTTTKFVNRCQVNYTQQADYTSAQGKQATTHTRASRESTRKGASTRSKESPPKEYNSIHAQVKGQSLSYTKDNQSLKGIVVQEFKWYPIKSESLRNNPEYKSSFKSRIIKYKKFI
jgi:hypothetical protein